MAETAVLCTDGSDLSLHALAAGRSLLRPELRPLLVTVIEPPDPTLVTGTGFAGGVLSPDDLTALQDDRIADATDTLGRAAEALGLEAAERRVVTGSPGPAICDVATEVGAAVVVIGSRGRGGLQRAVLGSVSDHVVRHSPCPVVVTAPD